jgi:pyruvate-formate lyase-activating enzyme
MNEIAVLTLQVTNKCPLKCAHCGPESGPDQRGSLSVAEAVSCMEDARARDCRVVNFSGGEPFVLGAALTEMVAFASSRSLVSRITTGAYWSPNADGAARRLEPLAKAGLKQLFISRSDGHNEFAPIQNAINAAQAAREFGINVCIVVNTSPDSETTCRSIREAFDDAGAIIPLMFESAIIPFGRASERWPASRLELSPVEQFAGPCPSLTLHPTVHSDGNIAGCAVVFGRQCAPLFFGRIGEQSLAEAVDIMSGDPLAQWIHKIGVVELKHLIENNSAIRFSDRYVNICHLCGDILHNAAALELLESMGFLTRTAQDRKAQEKTQRNGERLIRPETLTAGIA